MLNGLEATELKLSGALRNVDFRIDSEFHRKPLPENPSYKYVNVDAVLTLVQYGISIEMNEEGEGYPIYRMNEITNMLCDTDVTKFAKLSPEEAEPFTLQDNDVLFNRTNSQVFVGRTGIFKEFSDQPYVFASYLIRLRSNGALVLPEYLTTFFNSKFGVWDIKRRARISINQSNVNAEEIKAIRIPLLSLGFQQQLRKLFDEAHSLREQSKALYAEAETLLLDELGLKDWRPTDENVAVKSFAASFGRTGRLDAEYYQPKYQRAMSILSRSGKRIGDVAVLAKEKFNPSGLTSFNYIEIGNLSGDGSTEAEKISIEDTPSRAQWIVKTNDIITSTVRPIRKLSALIEPEQAGFICSSGFAVLRPKAIQPELLLVFLRAPIISEILDLHTTASMYPAISTEDLLQIPIALPSDPISHEIVRKIRDSRSVKKESKRLLNIAKRSVEIAIEQDEATALKWLEQQSAT